VDKPGFNKRLETIELSKNSFSILSLIVFVKKRIISMNPLKSS